MKIIGILWLGSLISLPVAAREVNLRLWISGGTQGVVMGSRECPGWLSIARQLEPEDPGSCWIHVGAPPLSPEKLKIPGLRFPEVLVPAEEDFRLQGLKQLESSALPFTLLNVAPLPQFPGYTPAFSPRAIWKQADGVEIHTFGLMSLQAPLRIPADRLRPLQVLPPLAKMRALLTEEPLADQVFPVLVLPEDADGAEWSARFPEIPLLILPPGSQSKVIEAQNGKQLRVQPAEYGRSVIRVQLYWDTVTRRFRDPVAEVVWINGPDLHGLELSEDILQRLHPLAEVPDFRMDEALLRFADAACLPEMKSSQIESRLPDALRVSASPEDDAWLKVKVSSAMWERWKAQSGCGVVERDRLGAEVEVLINAETAAGNGKWDSLIRQDLLHADFQKEWMPFTTRDLYLPLGDPP